MNKSHKIFIPYKAQGAKECRQEVGQIHATHSVMIEEADLRDATSKQYHWQRSRACGPQSIFNTLIILRELLTFVWSKGPWNRLWFVILSYLILSYHIWELWGKCGTWTWIPRFVILCQAVEISFFFSFFLFSFFGLGSKLVDYNHTR